MKTTVIHHSADYDGIFCREIARKFLPDAELIGWDFPDNPLTFPSEGTVYVLDLPVDRVFGFNQGSQVWPSIQKRLIWIDHHQSSIASHPNDIPGYRIDGVAACRLAWQWFSVFRCEPPRVVACDKFPTKQDFIDRSISEPLAVRLAGEYDIWDKRDDRTDVFQFGLRSRDLNESDWDSLLSTKKLTISEIEREIEAGTVDILNPDGTSTPSIVCELLRNGKLLQTYQQRNDSGMMHRSFIVEFEGLKFLSLTTARCNSLTFLFKDIPETGHDALMGFYYDGKKWCVSLYHAKHNTGIDLSQIAVKYGGGGHRGACGFQINKLPFIN